MANDILFLPSVAEHFLPVFLLTFVAFYCWFLCSVPQHFQVSTCQSFSLSMFDYSSVDLNDLENREEDKTKTWLKRFFKNNQFNRVEEKNWKFDVTICLLLITNSNLNAAWFISKSLSKDHWTVLNLFFIIFRFINDVTITSWSNNENMKIKVLGRRISWYQLCFPLRKFEWWALFASNHLPLLHHSLLDVSPK